MEGSFHMLEFIKTQTRQAAEQFLEKAGLKRGQILVVGCSSSEVGSFQIILRPSAVNI